MPKLWSEEDKIIDLSDINPNQMERNIYILLIQ